MSARTPDDTPADKSIDSARQPDDPRQQALDFQRRQQLDLLRDVELPRDARDSAGKGVRNIVLKAMLVAIDQYGRGRTGGCIASVATLAAAANCGLRTATRALEVLVAQGFVCVTNDGSRWGHRGQPTNRYTIVWSELAIRIDKSPLLRSLDERHAKRAPTEREAHPSFDDQSATSGALITHPPFYDQSATGTDQSATGTDQSATGTDQSATGGALNVRRQTSDVSAFKAPSDVPADDDEDGATKIFLEQEASSREAIKRKANRFAKYIDIRRSDNRSLIAKIALLWDERALAEDWCEQVLESFAAKRAAGDPIKNSAAWTWRTLANKCEAAGLNFERLLVETVIPGWLLLPTTDHRPPTPAPAEVPGG